GEVNHRLGIPQRFVVIESILADLPVITHQSLGIEIDGIAFLAQVGSEIEHAPHPTGKYIVTLGNHRPGLFVDKAQVFFRLRPASEVEGTSADVVTMLREGSTATVFGNRYR